MSYMWNDFNIKTFPAQTIVYRNGEYCPDLSTLSPGPINKKYDLPVHIIYVGEIAGKNELGIEIAVQNQPVFLSVDITNKNTAFFNIFIKNAGKNSEFRGHVLAQNTGDLTIDITARHMEKNTAVLIKNKILAGKNSDSKISGNAIIETGCTECTSDLGFDVMADPTARIQFTPAQFISAAPKSADHSASIYTPARAQILYLRNAGLTVAEATASLRDAFMKDFSLF